MSLPEVHEADRIANEARTWFGDNWDPNLSVRAWWKLLADSGWAFPTWPTEWFGRGVAPHLARGVADVRHEMGALAPPAGIAQHLAGPTLLAHATEEQKARWLPGIVQGEIWCQLFSEPSSGSDLASLQTRARRDGDEWVVDGQKVWTSGAHIARYGILIARTDVDVPKHQGLTYFVIDMHGAGIEIRPIREMTGRSIFNEVFFTEARVPDSNRIGGEGDGWGVALTTLANERTMLGAGSFGSSGSSVSIGSIDLDARAGDLVRPASNGRDSPRSGAGDLLLGLVDRYGARDDPCVRQDVARIYTLLEIARITELRVRAALDAGERPGPEVSIGKLAASNLLRDLRDVMFRICGPDAMLWGDDAPSRGRVHEVGLSSYLISIGGGTDQIQRNIIGERVLGLPREPRPDKDLPFSALARSATERP